MASHHQIEWVGSAASKAEILAACAAHAPQIILLDTSLPDASALEIITALGNAHDRVRVVGFSDSQDAELIKSMLRGGANGYMLTSEPLAQLVSCLPAVLLGKTILSGEVIPLLIQ
jgi:DNA-binding NarL/FixJ family response regulator